MTQFDVALSPTYFISPVCYKIGLVSFRDWEFAKVVIFHSLLSGCDDMSNESVWKCLTSDRNYFRNLIFHSAKVNRTCIIHIFANNPVCRAHLYLSKFPWNIRINDLFLWGYEKDNDVIYINPTKCQVCIFSHFTFVNFLFRPIFTRVRNVSLKLWIMAPCSTDEHVEWINGTNCFSKVSLHAAATFGLAKSIMKTLYRFVQHSGNHTTSGFT